MKMICIVNLYRAVLLVVLLLSKSALSGVAVYGQCLATGLVVCAVMCAPFLYIPGAHFACMKPCGGKTLAKCSVIAALPTP